MKASCACRRAEFERQKRAEDTRQRQAIETEQIRATYGWLGAGATDLPSKTLATFDGLRQPDAYQAVLSFADDPIGSLILYGSFGTGKTHLLAALCNELRSRGWKCRFTTAPELFKSIQSCISRDEDYTAIIRKAVQSELLLIDDIDKAKYSEFREEVYFSVINERANAGRPIALSTNRLDMLESYVGGACVSRLSIGQIAIEMSGADYRKEM